MKRLAVIGGGASGIAAAIEAARRGVKVTLIEGGARIGKKILASGNGKCNISNRNVTPSSYRTSYAYDMVNAIGESEIEAFFTRLGLPLKADADGRVYPYAEQASCVLNVLREELDRLGVEIETEHYVRRLSQTANGWSVDQRSYDAVVWACGSAATFGTDSLEMLSRLGLKVRAYEPSLAPLLTDVTDLGGLKGVRFKAEASLWSEDQLIASEKGEILIKDNGVSGIAIFNLSAVLAECTVKKPRLVLDFFPDMKEEELSAYLKIGTAGVAHKELIRNAVRRIGSSDPQALAAVLKKYPVAVRGVSHMSLAQVACGGVIPDQLLPSGEVKTLPGLYVTGEAVDADGKCGGYNLLFAWASGMTAGRDVCV